MNCLISKQTIGKFIDLKRRLKLSELMREGENISPSYNDFEKCIEDAETWMALIGVDVAIIRDNLKQYRFLAVINLDILINMPEWNLLRIYNKDGIAYVWAPWD
jgi:hypothetical protein